MKMNRMELKINLNIKEVKEKLDQISRDVEEINKTGVQSESLRYSKAWQILKRNNIFFYMKKDIKPLSITLYNNLKTLRD